MQRPPPTSGGGLLTAPDWWRPAFVGLAMMAGALTVLDAYVLVGCHFVHGTWRSSFSGLFDNRWLIVAITISPFAHTLVIYVPALRTAFRTVPLTTTDWLVTTTIAAMLIIVAELIKLATLMKSRRTPRILRFTRLGRGYSPPMEGIATEMPDVHWANN